MMRKKKRVMARPMVKKLVTMKSLRLPLLRDFLGSFDLGVDEDGRSERAQPPPPRRVFPMYEEKGMSWCLFVC